MKAVRNMGVAPEPANAVKRYIALQDFKKSTYLSQTSRGQRLSQRNVPRDSRHSILRKIGRERRGFKSFPAFVRLGSVRTVFAWDLKNVDGEVRTRT